MQQVPSPITSTFSANASVWDQAKAAPTAVATPMAAGVATRAAVAPAVKVDWERRMTVLATDAREAMRENMVDAVGPAKHNK